MPNFTLIQPKYQAKIIQKLSKKIKRASSPPLNQIGPVKLMYENLLSALAHQLPPSLRDTVLPPAFGIPPR